MRQHFCNRWRQQNSRFCQVQTLYFHLLELYFVHFIAKLNEQVGWWQIFLLITHPQSAIKTFPPTIITFGQKLRNFIVTLRISFLYEVRTSIETCITAVEKIAKEICTRRRCIKISQKCNCITPMSDVRAQPQMLHIIKQEQGGAVHRIYFYISTAARFLNFY